MSKGFLLCFRSPVISYCLVSHPVLSVSGNNVFGEHGSLCENTQAAEKKYNLEVPLVSEQGKKANSFQQVRSDGVYEEVTATASQTTPKEAPDGPRSSVGDCGPKQPEPLPSSDSTRAQTSQS